MVLSLPGQSVALWGHPSHVASCGSHSAGMVKPSLAGDGDVLRPPSAVLLRRTGVACCVKVGDLAINFAKIKRSTDFAFSLSPQRGEGRVRGENEIALSLSLPLSKKGMTHATMESSAILTPHPLSPSRGEGEQNWRGCA